MSVALVVVEPASIPRNTGPLAFLMSFLLTLSFAWRVLKMSYSASFENRASICLVSDMSAGSAFPSLSTSVLSKISPDFSASSDAPIATKYLESSGKIISSGARFKVSMNLCLSSDKNDRGPPRKATFPLIV